MKNLIVAALAFSVFAVQAALPFLDFEDGEGCVYSPSKDDATGIRGFSESFATSGQRSFRLGSTEEHAQKTGFAVAELRRKGGPISDLSSYDRLVFDAVNLDEDEKSVPVYPVVGAERVRKARFVVGLKPFEVTTAVVPLSAWRTAGVNLKDVRGLSVALSNPNASFVHFDNFVFLKPGESMPARSEAFAATVRQLGPAKAAWAQRKADEEAKRLAAERARQRTELAAFLAGRGRTAPRAGAMAVAAASGMDQIRPQVTDCAKLRPADRLAVSLARGEYESVQLAVVADGRDLRNVRATAEGFPFDVKCRTIGYVDVRYPLAYQQAYCEPSVDAPGGYVRKTRMTPLGWYADPILDFQSAADVPANAVQGFLVTVQAPRDARRGTYAGTVRVSADGEGTVGIPLSVRIYGFEMPKVSPLPLLINFTPFVQPRSLSWTPEQAEELRCDPEAPVNLWKRHRETWADFLAEYFIGPGTVYSPMRTADLPDLDLLVREDRRGRLGTFVFGSWASKDEEDWTRRLLPILRHRYEQVKAAGLADRAVLYAYDETEPKFFAGISNAAVRCHRDLPGVKLSTTAYDDDFGVGTILGGVDWFTPQTPKFRADAAAKARAEGRQVWWYVACGQKAPLANSFVENPLADLRLLLGAQAVRMKPEGFLYYAIAKWNQKRPITSGPYVDWSPVGIRHAGMRAYDGDGVWAYCGPDGTPVSTLRLENFRDGIEDYAYATELAARLKRHPADDAWAREARRLLAVPESVMVSITNFTDDAGAVYAWRDRMAELIEKEVSK